MNKKKDGWVMIRPGGKIHAALTGLPGPRAKIGKFLAEEFEKNGGKPVMCRAKTLKMVLELDDK